jgi:hypothetical protein
LCLPIAGKSPRFTLGLDTWLGLIATGMSHLTFSNSKSNTHSRVEVLGVLDAEAGCVWLYPALGFHLWKLEQKEATGVTHT